MEYEYYYMKYDKHGFPKLIDFAELSKDKCQWICENLIAIPQTIGITYEVIPTISIYNEKEFYVSRYKPYERSTDYLIRHSDAVIKALQAEQKDEMYKQGVLLEDAHRLLAHIWGLNPDDKKPNGFLRPITLEYDFQERSSAKLGIFSSQMGRIFLHFIAPLAMLVPEASELEAVKVLPCNEWHAMMKYFDGPTKAALENVWDALHGTIDTDIPLASAASNVISAAWNWQDGETGEIAQFWAKTFQEFFAFCAGKYGTAHLAQWRNVAQNADKWIRQTYHMLEKDEDEDDE